MFALSFSIFFLGLAFTGAWNYADEGPSTWASSYATCGGSNQSPIDVVTSSAEYNSDLTLSPSGYDTSVTFDVSNNGHGITFTKSSGTVSLVAKDLYNMEENTWSLLQFHAHWGTSDSEGSENTIDGTKYPMEVHLVHINDKYSSGHTSNDDGLLVLGFMFEIDASSSEAGVSDFTAAIPGAEYPGNTTTSTLALTDLIPDNWDSGVFYSWRGSLTTPGCQEAVSWYLFGETIKVTAADMATIRSSIYDDELNVVDTCWRPIQTLAGRTVYTNAGSQVTVSLSFAFLLAAVVKALSA